MKLTIIGKRDVEFVGSKGETIKGFMYLSFTDANTGLEFFSKKDYDFYPDCLTFTTSNAIAVDLIPKLGRTGIKYSERNR